MRASRTDAASQRQVGKNPSFTQEENDISVDYAWEGASPNDLLRTAWAGKISPHISVIVQLHFLTGDATVRGGKDPESGKLLRGGVWVNAQLLKSGCCVFLIKTGLHEEGGKRG